MAAATIPLPPAPVSAGASSTIDVTISGLRNNHGVVRLMLCPAAHPFPDCGHAGVAQVAVIKDGTATATFHNIAPDTYAIAAFHDENGNGVLDTFMGMPREGYGFSKNPPFHARAPYFAECDFAVATDMTVPIKMKYLF
jgi:uncharacterized protein (DUF2141 family)